MATILTCSEAAQLTGYSASHLKDLCAAKLVKGAQKMGKTWVAPEKSWRKLASEKETRHPGRPKKR